MVASVEAWASRQCGCSSGLTAAAGTEAGNGCPEVGALPWQHDMTLLNSGGKHIPTTCPCGGLQPRLRSSCCTAMGAARRRVVGWLAQRSLLLTIALPFYLLDSSCGADRCKQLRCIGAALEGAVAVAIHDCSSTRLVQVCKMPGGLYLIPMLPSLGEVVISTSGCMLTGHRRGQCAKGVEGAPAKAQTPAPH